MTAVPLPEGGLSAGAEALLLEAIRTADEGRVEAPAAVGELRARGLLGADHEEAVSVLVEAVQLLSGQVPPPVVDVCGHLY